MLIRKIASLYILFSLLFWGLWFFGVYDYIWEKYQIHRITPDLRINIIGLDKTELDKRYYHFVTGYTESGLPLKGGVGFTKKEYDAARQFLRDGYGITSETFNSEQIDQLRK